MKINYNFLISLFFISAVIGVGISYSKVYLFHIMLAIILGYSIFNLFKAGKDNWKDLIQKNESQPTRLHYFFYIMLAWYLLSLFWSINIQYSFIYLAYILLGSTLSLTIIYYNNSIARQINIFKAISGAFIVEILFGLLEALTNFRLPISPYSSYVEYFGRNGNDFSQLSKEMLSYLNSMPTGFQWNPNDFATTMVIILPFFLFHRNKIIKIAGLVSIITLIVASSSKGNFLAAILIIFGYLLLYNRKTMKLTLLIVPILILTSYLSFGIIKNIENVKIKEVVSTFNTLRMYLSDEEAGKGSIGVRQQLINNGLDALKNSKGLGVGGGASKAVQEEKGGVGSKKIISMHNFWVEILVESGILFTLVFLSWYVKACVTLYKNSFKAENEHLRYFSAATSLSMLGFTVAALSPSSVIYHLPMWLLFGFAVTTINNQRRVEDENREQHIKLLNS